MKRTRLLLIVAAIGIVAASTGTVLADVIVGSTAPPQPGGQFILDDLITSGFTESFTVPNVAVPNYTKNLWMQVTMNTANGFPQAPGQTFDQSLWPVVFATGSATTITGAADVGYGSGTAPWQWYLTATIIPQPASETITFPESWWTTWGSNIESIDVYTACVPEPAVWLTNGVVFLAVGGVWWYHRRKALMGA